MVYRTQLKCGLSFYSTYLFSNYSSLESLVTPQITVTILAHETTVTLADRFNDRDPCTKLIDRFCLFKLHRATDTQGNHTKPAKSIGV